ncbi:MAG: hypothetical protein AAFY28_22565, partial [Actinomycetota bacterium]
NGYGTELTGIDPAHGIVTYSADGLGGWRRTGGLSDVVARTQDGYWIDTGASLLDASSFYKIIPSSGGGEIVVGDGYGVLRDQIVVSGPMNWGMSRYTATTTIEELTFGLDENGTVVDASIVGSHTSYATDVALEFVEGVLLDDGTLHLSLSDASGWTHAQLKLYTSAPLQHAVSSEPQIDPSSEAAMLAAQQMAVSDYGETMVVASDPWAAGDVKLITKIDATQPFADSNVDITSVRDLYIAAGVDPVAAPGTVPQAVDITPDGNTVAVMQPVGSGYRVDVIDRASTSSAWSVIGSFSTDATRGLSLGTAPFAIGRDSDYRYAAVVNGSNVEIHTKYRTAPWELASSHAVSAPVNSMSFDYFAEHLAVGLPAAGTTVVLQRELTDPSSGTRSWTNWVADRDLTSTDVPRFGTTVAYSYGLLAVSGDGAYDSVDPAAPKYTPGQLRLYRDTDPNVSWGAVSSWTIVDVGGGTGPHVSASTGGTATTPRLVAATVVHDDTAPHDTFGSVSRYRRSWPGV